MDKIQQFVKERNSALASLDEPTIRMMGAKWGVPMSSDPEVFWRGVHKAISACSDLPSDVRQRSIKWLIARGSEPWV